MSIWAVVEDAAGGRVGGGPVSIRDFDATRKLDMAGTWRATAIGSDRRALAALDINHVVRIWRETAANPAQEVSAGIITTRQFTDVAGGFGLIVDGPDLLDELRRKNTLVGRNYNQVSLDTAVQGLIALVPGWTAVVDAGIASTVVDAGFDGYTVLKALVELAHRYDCHLRQSGTPGQRQIEISQLASASLHTVRNAPTVAGEFGGTGVVLRMAEDQISTTGDNYYNLILPFGKGEGEAALTLASSTRTMPYPIQTIVGPDLRTLHYLATTTYPTSDYATPFEDPASRQLVAQMRDIGPLSNSIPDLRNAANALYDEALEKLTRAATIQRCYNVTMTGVADLIRAGDRVRALYHADTPGGGGVPFLSVDGTFIVLEATESVDEDNHIVTIKISNIDRHPTGAKEILLDAINKMALHSLRPNIVQGAPTAYVYQREIAPGLNAEVPVEFTDSTLEVNRVRMRLKTAPLRTTAVDTLDVPAHRHIVGVFSSQTNLSTNQTSVLLSSGAGGFSNIGGNNAGIMVPGFAPSGQTSWYTDDTEPDITSTIAFNIHDDTEVPGNISVHLNNSDITQQLFGSAVLAPDVQLVAPPGLLADFSILVGTINSAGNLWHETNGNGTLLAGADRDIEVPFPDGNTAVLNIERVYWRSVTGGEQFHIGRINAGPDFEAQDDNFGNESVYIWDGSSVYEFDFSDSDRARNDDNSIIWDSGPVRPTSMQTGDEVRFIVATENNVAAVRAFCSTQPVAATAINEVGDPGVLANLIMAAGLQQEHEIEIRCGVGRGRVEVTIERWETTQSILRRS